jgi:transposase
MQEAPLYHQNRAKYAKISLEVFAYFIQKRVRLTSLVFKNSLSISKAAKMLGIRPSTAKLIIKKYKQDGTYFQSKKDKQKSLENKETPLEC